MGQRENPRPVRGDVVGGLRAWRKVMDEPEAEPHLELWDTYFVSRHVKWKLGCCPRTDMRALVRHRILRAFKEDTCAD